MAAKNKNAKKQKPGPSNTKGRRQDLKVYELARRLEVSSVALMDKIRKDWKLPVRTHMEALTPEMAQNIERKFRRAAAKKLPAKAKKPVKKPAAAKKAKPPAAEASAEPAKKTSKKPAKKTSKKKQPKQTKKTEGKKPKKPAAKKTRPAAAKKPASPAPKKPLKPAAKAAPPQSPPPAAGAELPRPLKTGRIIRRRKSEQPLPAPVRPDPSAPKEGGPPEGAEPLLSPDRSASKSIRSDMVSVKNADPLGDNFWSLKEAKEAAAKKQPRKPMVEKEVSSKFLATDFRKREMIFQPKKKKAATGEFKAPQITTPKAHKRVLKVHGEMALETVCQKMGIKRRALIGKLKKEGLSAAGLQTLDFETIALIVPDFGFEAKNTKKTEEEVLESAIEGASGKKSGGKKSFQPKPPVVTVMGHVDHGKTTLLDAMRKTKVAEGEAGGITQHIGAYTVPFKNSWITFIDTPGHEAFTAMRSRGAKVTDIAVIVVSASDGVMPQTVEALNHARAAKTPLIVAMTKMDVPGASPEKIKKRMAEHNLTPEEWGGDTRFIPLAAPKGEGIDSLLEQIQLMAETMDLKCQPGALAKGWALEARREKGRGPVVSLLIQDGTLKSGQSIVAGVCSGRIRQMKNDQGRIIKEAGPGFAVEASGLNELPETGDVFHALDKEKAAKEIISFRQAQEKKTESAASSLSPEEALIQAHIQKQQKKDLNLILKTDAQGSMEAIKSGLEKLKADDVSVKAAHSATGGITESDVLLASAVSGLIVGFNVRPDSKASKMARDQGIETACFSVIYELLDYVKKKMLGLLEPEILEESLGAAEVREIFSLSKAGVAAGCYVTSGKMARNSFVRLVRDGRLIYEGSISSLKRFKEDAKEVSAGLECGVMIDKFNDIKPKDILESYIKKEVARTEL